MRLPSRVLLTFAFAVFSVFLAGCATTPSSSQMQNLRTDASQVPMGFANSAFKNGACVKLSEHQVQGKVGVTLGHDLTLLADEIDNVVSFNGGNAYMLHSWQWIVVDGLGSTAPLVDITVLTCGTAPPSVETRQADIRAPQEPPGGYSEIDFCTDMSKIGKTVMVARQQDKPMSQAIRIAMTQFERFNEKYSLDNSADDVKEGAAAFVSDAYDVPSWDSPELQQDEISRFENAIFKGCFEYARSELSARDTYPTDTSSTSDMWVCESDVYSEEKNAEFLAKHLRVLGYAAFVIMEQTDSGDVFRVEVGPQKDRASALQVAARLAELKHNCDVVPYP